MHISSFKEQSHYIFLLIKNASPVCVREELAGAYEGKAKVGKVNVDEQGDIAEQYGVMSIPAFVVIKDGKVVDQGLGAMPKAKLEAMLSGAI
ncbi:MAG: hypothetical protein J6U41_01480 [Lachnospiraceae bacterium]|nr:hypothetical protein [Lachnospiraceae bacterium]